MEWDGLGGSTGMRKLGLFLFLRLSQRRGIAVRTRQEHRKARIHATPKRDYDFQS